MTTLSTSWSRRSGWFDSTGREQRIKDYIELTRKLIWQRQATFLAATMLSAFYFDALRMVACYGLVLFSEVFDLMLSPAARKWTDDNPRTGRMLLIRITFNTVLSALAIGFFVIQLAVQQHTGGHFTPLFFLFAASLFAAMNNSQMIGILLLRLSIYSGAFMFITFYDVFRYQPPIYSRTWLEFFTSVFVLYFIADMSLAFYKQYQERLEQLKKVREENRRTKAAYEIKSQFLSTVSHELRTPLTSIKASLDLVNNGVLGEVPENLRPALAIAAKNSHRLANLIDDLLDLQKIEAGEMVFHFDKIDVAELVKEAVESTKSYADHLGIHVATVLPTQEMQMRGDHSRLIQVMHNLMSNALKFSREGGTVQVRVEARGPKVRISVQDEGVGIPENARDKVFGKFSQVDSSDIRKVGGTGLGMNITKQIVERHEGKVDYESKLGEGSTFYVEFDRLPEAAGDEDARNPVALTA
ncbi:MAG: HAMP domain-containing histidine kinase [Maritimibacter sp.]|nr:HAMP domain-containing histidine kinase [Maritimibacter sp.]